MPNALAHESSPYLLQHAYNPVNWYPWGEAALQKAKAENKIILLSIGYAACHWCHVMEKQCFEDQAIAQVMNEHFVAIKVDREERPDIDSLYMEALQAMGLQGGWPLNVFLLPDQRPFYGGTYFPPDQWVQLLQNIQQAFVQHREQLEESAKGFTQSLNASEIEKYSLTALLSAYRSEDLDLMFDKLATYFDETWGGMQRAPKFPMPTICTFLLRYHFLTQHPLASQQLHLTLQKMAWGGIYDQVGGGFARYAVDEEWFAPHFEKMLYDNAQLISLYTEAYLQSKQSLYKEVVYESIAFVAREMRHTQGAFYSALDADSEGSEGKFYVWTYEQLKALLPTQDLALCCAYYQIKEQGNWEHENNILFRKMSDEVFAQKHQIDTEVLRSKVAEWKAILFEARLARTRPTLDDKSLTSWNALMLKALAEAYRAFDEADFLEMALQNAHFLKTNMLKADGSLWHSYKNGKSSIEGYLEDYAALGDAYIALYQATFDTQWLLLAQKLAEYTIKEFYDTKEGFFFFTAHHAEKLIARKKEIFDNVIPSSNAVMAHVLYTLSLVFPEKAYHRIAEDMLQKMRRILLTDVQYACHWAVLFAMQLRGTAEVVIVGENCQELRRELDKEYYPHKIILGTSAPSESLPPFAQRGLLKGQSTFYVCQQQRCQLPVLSTAEALRQMKAL